MQILTILKSSAVVLTTGTLAACGGGGGGGAAVIDAPTFGDLESTANSNLVALVLNPSTESVAVDTGTLNRGDGTGSIGGLTGTLSADRSEINIAGGGAITFEPNEDGFAVRFDAAQTGSNTLGIAGIATAASDLPSGTATYAGDTVLTVQNGVDLYDVAGVANVTAAFGADTPTVTTTLTDLAATAQTDTPDVADLGVVTLTGSAIDGVRFSGGTATVTSDIIALSGDETVDLEGAFYGPDGGEVGGVFTVIDGDVRIFGDFLAD